MPAITDDDRILLALERGLTVRDYEKAGYGWSHRREAWTAIQVAPEEDAKHVRGISGRAFWRCVRNGLIKTIEGPNDNGSLTSLTSELTDAGRIAAAALTHIDADKALAPPKQKNRPEGMDFWEASEFREARKALREIVLGGKHIRAHWHDLKPDEVHYYELAADDRSRRSNLMHLDSRQFAYIASYVEHFLWPGSSYIHCFRANEAGIELITKRRPLPNPHAKAA